MSNKFLNNPGTNADVTDGSTNIFGRTIGALNLESNFPVKTDSLGRLFTTKLLPSDINPPAGSGDVSTTGAPVNDTGIPVYDGVSGNFIKQTSVTIDSSDNMTGAQNLTGANVIGTFDVTTPILTLDSGSFSTNLTRPNSGTTHTLSLPDALLGADQLLQFNSSGIGSYILKSSLLSSPLSADLDFSQNKATNISEIVNTGGSIAINTTGTLQMEQTGVGNLNIHHSGASGDLDVSSIAGRVLVQSAHNVADAVFINSTVGGLDVNTMLDTTIDSDNITLTSGSSNFDSILLQSSTGGVKVQSDFPILIQGDAGLANSVDIQAGGGGDILMTASSVDIVGGLTVSSSLVCDDLIQTDSSLQMKNASTGRIASIFPPPNSIPTSYSLILPATKPSPASNDFRSLLLTTGNQLLFSTGNVGFTASIEDPITASVDDICVFSNVTQNTIKIDSAPASIQSSRFSGFITGVIPTALANVASIFVVDGETVFDITPAGDVLHKDVTDPQNIIYTIKNIPEMLNITATELGQVGVTTFYVYVDTRSTPITVSDVIQRITPPSEKNPFEVYLGNIDLRDGGSPPNDVIQRHNQFSESCYSHPDTSNTLLFNRGRYNLTGCLFSAFSTTLEVTHSLGTAVRLAVNTVNSLEVPDTIDTVADSISISRYQYFDNTDWQVATVTNRFLIPGMWNDSGTLSVVANNRYTIQYIYFFYGSDSCRFQYGDVEYATFAIAENNLQAAPRIENPAVGEAVLRSAVILAWDATDLTDGTKAKFFDLSN